MDTSQCKPQREMLYRPSTTSTDGRRDYLHVTLTLKNHWIKQSIVFSFVSEVTGNLPRVLHPLKRSLDPYPKPWYWARGRCSLPWSSAWGCSLIRWGCPETPAGYCCRRSPRAPPAAAAAARGNPSGESRPRRSCDQPRAEPRSVLRREQEVNEGSTKTAVQCSIKLFKIIFIDWDKVEIKWNTSIRWKM